MSAQSQPLEHSASDLPHRVLAGILIATIWGITIYISFLHLTIKAMS